jgi:Uma2 family endonuclease
VTKRDEYAEAGIPESWIVDPQRKTITVLVLMPRAKTYIEHGTFTQGMRATSLVLPGFTVDVTETFARRP